MGLIRGSLGDGLVPSPWSPETRQWMTARPGGCERVPPTRKRRGTPLQPECILDRYDYIVADAGAAGCVAAENAHAFSYQPTNAARQHGVLRALMAPGGPQHHIQLTNPSPNRLRQPRPIPPFNEKRNRGFAHRIRKSGDLLIWDLRRPRAPKNQIEIAPVVASTVDPAAVGPHLDIRQMLAEQGVEDTPMP